MCLTGTMIGRDFPEVVEKTLDILAETEKFRDFRIVGNLHGTTLVLRYSRIESVRCTPLWKHRSPVNLTRDNARQNTWIKSHTNVNWSTGATEEGSICVSPQFPTSSTTWNVDAPIFNLQAQTVDMETQTDCKVIQNADMSCQTENLIAFTSSGSQCGIVETKNVGISCKLAPQTKVKHVQATIGVKHQGVNCVAQTTDCYSQVERHDLNVKTIDQGVWINQSPGDTGRHSQTEKVIFKDRKTNTEKILTTSRAIQANPVGTSTRTEVGGRDHVNVKSHDNIPDSTNPKGISKNATGVENQPRQKGETTRVGLLGLMTLLNTLKAPCSTRDQFATNVHLNNRNKTVKGIIEQVCGKVIDYWAVFDDFCIMINKVGETLLIGNHVKMFGQYERDMFGTDDYKNNSLVNPSSDLYEKCQNLALLEMKHLLPSIRYEYSGRYSGHGYDLPNTDGNRGYEEYGSRRGYGCHSGYQYGLGGSQRGFGGYRGGYRSYKKLYVHSPVLLHVHDICPE